MSKLRFARPFVGVTAAVLVSAGLGVATAPAALAALPMCAATTKITTPTTYVTYIIPATAGGSTDCQLRRTDKSEGVKILQQALNACYGAGLTLDGNFGALTQQALTSAQKASGASPDGIYGPNTRDHLKWPSSAASNPCRIL